VLTPTLRTDQEAGRVAQRLLDAVREPYALDRGEVRVTASIGVAVYPRDGADATELIKSADVAMFAAKEAGRDGWQLFDRSMHERLRRVARISANLAHALDRGEFELHYQPQVDARTGALVGVEALLRWNSPEGTVPPAEFVPIAEQTGIIVPIGEWVLRTAMRDALSWRDAGLGDVRVAVNLSARQFRDRQVVGVVLGALRDIPLPRRCSSSRSPSRSRCATPSRPGR
jgi:predicted signal transduction protein with EAL and GGDEF domain